MFCMNCGKKIDDGSKFCQFCGSPIGGTTSTGSQNFSAPTSSQISNIAGASVLKTAKKPISKNALVGIVACVIALLAIVVIFIINSNKFGKTFPEKLFEMPIEDYASMTRASFKEMLDEEGVLYTQDSENDDYYYTIQTTVPDTFMGCDCTYSYSYDDAFNMFTSTGIKKDSSILATYGDALQIYIAFDTTEDFKDFKEDLEKNLNKKLVKGETVVKTELDDVSVYSYLVECSDQDVGFVFNEPAQLKMYLDNWYVEYDNNNDLYLDLREYLTSEEFDEESIQSIQSLKKIYAERDYKVYKFIQVAYLQDMDIEDIHYLIPSDKSYTDITCMINVACVTLTEEGCDELIRFWENGRL